MPIELHEIGPAIRLNCSAMNKCGYGCRIPHAHNEFHVSVKVLLELRSAHFAAPRAAHLIPRPEREKSGEGPYSARRISAARLLMEGNNPAALEGRAPHPRCTQAEPERSLAAPLLGVAEHPIATESFAWLIRKHSRRNRSIHASASIRISSSHRLKLRMPRRGHLLGPGGESVAAGKLIDARAHAHLAIVRKRAIQRNQRARGAG